MSDILNTTGRSVLAIAVILFCCTIIVVVLLRGDPANSLHGSALAWSYSLVGAILVTLGVAAAIPALTAPKPP